MCNENLLHINNRQQTDAIQASYRKTGGLYTCRSGLVQIGPQSYSELESVVTLFPMLLYVPKVIKY